MMGFDSQQPARRLHRVYEHRRPDPIRVEIHRQDCPCVSCAPYLGAASSPRLTFAQIGNRVWVGLAIGTAIAFAIDPHGAWLALTTVFGGGR